VQRGEKSHFGALLVGRAASADGPSERVIEYLPFKRWRGPIGGIELLDVIHEIDAERPPRAGVQRAEHRRDAAGRHRPDAAEPRLRRQPRHQRRALRHIALLGRDRGQCDPFAQPTQRLLVSGIDGAADRVPIAAAPRLRKAGARRQHRGRRGCPLQNVAALGRGDVFGHGGLPVASGIEQAGGQPVQPG